MFALCIKQMCVWLVNVREFNLVREIHRVRERECCACEGQTVRERREMTLCASEHCNFVECDLC